MLECRKLLHVIGFSDLIPSFFDRNLYLYGLGLDGGSPEINKRLFPIKEYLVEIFSLHNI